MDRPGRDSCSFGLPIRTPGISDTNVMDVRGGTLADAEGAAKTVRAAIATTPAPIVRLPMCAPLR
jgi:hypothetical protein